MADSTKQMLSIMQTLSPLENRDAKRDAKRDALDQQVPERTDAHPHLAPSPELAAMLTYCLNPSDKPDNTPLS